MGRSEFNFHLACSAMLFFWVGVHLASAQTVEGRVLDRQQNPLVGAYVTNGVVTTSTDLDGAYSLSLKPGSHVLVCTFIGMAKQELTVELTAGQTMNWNPQLASTAEALGLVVVSAGRFEQDASEVTVSLEVLKPALVENKATTTLETAIEQTPGVSLVDGEPQIRSGSGFSYGAGSRVMVLVDDLPVLSGDAGRPTWGFLPLENLEQIEVIKGASSVLYGSAALSGVINIRTRYPDARPLTRVSLQHGVYSAPQSAPQSQYWDGTLQQSNMRFLHSQQMGGWDVVVGGNVLGDDGFKGPEIYTDSAGVATDTAAMNYNPLSVDRWGANAQARINLNLRRRETGLDGLKFGLNTNWQKGESMNTLIWDNHTTGLYSSYAGAATRTKQLVGTVDPYVEYLSPTGMQHSLRNRWQHLNNDNDNDQGNSSHVFYSEYQMQQRGDAWGLDGLMVTAGAMHQYTRGRAQLYSGGRSDGLNEARNASAYTQIDQAIGQRLNLSVGGRYEHFSINDSTASKPVFRAGLNHQPAQATWVRASWGQGFRFPTIAEKFIRTGLGQLQIYPNTNLRPETAVNMELGVKQGLQIGGFRGFLDVAVFRQTYEDFIEFSFGGWGDPGLGEANLFGLGFRSLNTGNSQVTGWETSLVGQIEEGETTLNVLAGYTYTNPVSTTPEYNYNPDGGATTYASTSYDTTGHVLKYRSQHLVRFDAELQRGKWFLGLSARYQSGLQNFDRAFVDLEAVSSEVNWGIAEWIEDHSRFNYRTNRMESSLPTIFDLRAGVNLTDAHKFSVVVSNLTNAEYSIRPLAIEAPRLVNVVYTYEIH